MRIAVASFAHETNTWSSERTGLSDFQALEYARGEEVRARHQGVRSYLGGMFDEAREAGIEAVPILSAVAEPSGTIEDDCYVTVAREIVAGIRAALAAGPLDGLALALHGAGATESRDDLEGELLLDVRRAVGPDLPVVVTLDLHANVTPEMVARATALLGVHRYPHVDEYERGREAVSLLRRAVEEGVRPVGHFAPLPMLLTTTTTEEPPGSLLNEICLAREALPEVLDCAFFHGFPYTDVPCVGAGVMVWVDGARIAGDPKARAREIAEGAAREIWAVRERLRPRRLTAEEAVARALELAEAPSGAHGPVVIHETSDNPGGGAPGDGTHLLRAMLAAGLGRRLPGRVAYGHIFDPETARKAHGAGAGATIEVRLGGKTDDLHGAPIEGRAEVMRVSDGRFVLTTPMGRGATVDLGPSARLRIDGVDVVVASVRTQVLDPGPFALHGLDVRELAIVGLKSSQHFRAGFAPFARAIVTADPPGLTTMDVSAFPYRRIRRPVWPLDPEADPETLWRV